MAPTPQMRRAWPQGLRGRSVEVTHRCEAEAVQRMRSDGKGEVEATRLNFASLSIIPRP